MDWGPIATTPYPGEPGGTPAVIADDHGGLDDPTVILPESAVQLVEPDGTHVSWLPLAKTWTWRRSKTDPGSGQVTLAKSDPIVAEMVWPRQVRFFDQGVIRQRMLIEPVDSKTVAQAEESGEEVTITGPGQLALAARMRLDPLRLDLQPKQGSVRFNHAHTDLEDYSSLVWVAVVDAGEYGQPTDWDGGGTHITGPSGDHDFAPGGTYYFRAPAPFTLADDTDVAIIMTADNLGRAWLNGVDVIRLDTFDSSNYLRSHEIRLRLSAGDHFLAGSMFNQSSDTPDPEFGNPGSVRIVVWSLDSNGKLGSIITETTPDWVAYEFLQSRPPDVTRPGWTVGGILAWGHDKITDRIGVTVPLTCDIDEDTASAAWPIIDEFTGTVGSWYDVLQALQEAHCDLDWAADVDELSAWKKDTRGSTLSLDLPAGYTDTENGCLKDLSHQVEPPVLTSALVEWRDGYVIVEAEADYPVERKIDAPLVASDVEATRIGQYAIDTFGVERVQGTATLRPRSDAQRPGLAFDVADTVNLPDRDLELVPQVIQSYSCTVAGDSQITWQIEFGDLLYNQQERFGNWLKGISNGTLGGRTFQTTQYRQEVPTPAAPRRREPIVFDRNSDDATGESRPFPADDYLTIQTITVAIPGEEGADVEVLVNGVAVWSETIAASVPLTVERELDEKVIPGDLITASTPDGVAMVVSVFFS